MSIVLTEPHRQAPPLVQQSIHTRLDTAQANIRHAQKAVTLHEGLTLDPGTSDELWNILQKANNSLDAERREREAEAFALHAKAEEWNAAELAMFAYMAEMAKERLAEINAQHEEGKR
jgi:hypothetical protein